MSGAHARTVAHIVVRAIEEVVARRAGRLGREDAERDRVASVERAVVAVVAEIARLRRVVDAGISTQRRIARIDRANAVIVAILRIAGANASTAVIVDRAGVGDAAGGVARQVLARAVFGGRERPARRVVGGVAVQRVARNRRGVDDRVARADAVIDLDRERVDDRRSRSERHADDVDRPVVRTRGRERQSEGAPNAVESVVDAQTHEREARGEGLEILDILSDAGRIVVGDRDGVGNDAARIHGTGRAGLRDRQVSRRRAGNRSAVDRNAARPRERIRPRRRIGGTGHIRRR